MRSIRALVFVCHAAVLATTTSSTDEGPSDHHHALRQRHRSDEVGDDARTRWLQECRTQCSTMETARRTCIGTCGTVRNPARSRCRKGCNSVKNQVKKCSKTCDREEANNNANGGGSGNFPPTGGSCKDQCKPLKQSSAPCRAQCKSRNLPKPAQASCFDECLAPYRYCLTGCEEANKLPEEQPTDPPETLAPTVSNNTFGEFGNFSFTFAPGNFSWGIGNVTDILPDDNAVEEDETEIGNNSTFGGLKAPGTICDESSDCADFFWCAKERKDSETTVCCKDVVLDVPTGNWVCRGQQDGDQCSTNMMVRSLCCLCTVLHRALRTEQTTCLPISFFLCNQCSSDVCVEGACIPDKRADGETCDYYDDADCTSGACAHETYDIWSDIVCCGAGAKIDGAPYGSSYTVCAGQMTGAACFADELCTSGTCVDNVCV